MITCQTGVDVGYRQDVPRREGADVRAKESDDAFNRVSRVRLLVSVGLVEWWAACLACSLQLGWVVGRRCETKVSFDFKALVVIPGVAANQKVSQSDVTD